MIELYVIGISILIIAIMANIIGEKFGITSWYDFVEMLQIYGKKAFFKLDLKDYVWLALIYPLILGAGYLFGKTVHDLIF